MFGRIPAFRPTLAAVALVAAASFTPAAARAQSTVTVNFNSLTDDPDHVGVRQIDNCYTESGFQLQAVGVACGTPVTFAAAFPDNIAAATGQTSLYLNTPATNQVDLTRVGGGQFGIQSIDLAPFVGLGGSIGFTGFFANGMSTTESFTVADASMFALQPLKTFTFNGAFTGLTSLRMTITQPDGNAYLNFDNLVMTTASATAVPEPTTVALLAGGLFGVGMLARTRGSRRRAESAPLA